MIAVNKVNPVCYSSQVFSLAFSLPFKMEFTPGIRALLDEEMEYEELLFEDPEAS